MPSSTYAIASDGDVFSKTRQHNRPSSSCRLQCETRKFISMDLRPLISFDPGPFDCRTWSLMWNRVYQAPVRHVTDLRRRLIDVWDGLSQIVVDNAINERRKRIQTCVDEGQGTF